MKELSDVIFQHRKAADLSQRECAELAGVGKTVVFDIEHGKTSIRLSTLLPICRVLNIKLMANGVLGTCQIEMK